MACSSSRLGFLLATWAMIATAAAEPAVVPVPFDTHTGYYVSNKFEPAQAVSMVKLIDQASFDEVFGVAQVMGDASHRLEPGVFQREWVVAVIHRGKEMVNYHVQSVTRDDDTLVVRYTTATEPSASAEFACPLIISVAKPVLKHFRFIENGRALPDVLTKVADGKTWVTIRGGDGIGRTTLHMAPDAPPMVLRLHLHGLESLTIDNGQLRWQASVLSHGDHATLLHLWQDGKEQPPLAKDSPYATVIRRLDADGQQVAGLPPAGGWFEVPVPVALTTGTKELKLAWIDFYR